MSTLKKPVRLFKQWYWLSVILPIILILQQKWGMMSGAHVFFRWLSIIFALVSIGIFVHQFVFGRRDGSPIRHALKLELIMLVVAVLALPLAYFAGDMYGAQHFSDSRGLRSSPAALAILLLVGPVVGASVFAIANTLKLMHATAFKIIGYIGYGLLWCAVVAVSYIAFSLAYVVHDPTVE